MVRQASIRGEKQRRPASTVPDVHRGALEKEVTKNLNVGRVRCDVLDHVVQRLSIVRNEVVVSKA